LRLVARLKERGDLSSYHLLWSVEADLLRRLGRKREAATSYEQALSFDISEPERRFLQRRLDEVRS
jgi:RNA polymerase sigma-70 factor (ECF subfamily)